MRPKAIAYFEWLIFGTLALGIVHSYLSWGDLVAVAGVGGADPSTFVLLTQAFSLASIVILTLLITRRRSKIAMWVSIIFFLTGMLMFLPLALQGLLMGSHTITAIQTVGQLIAYGLLFTPAARTWMNRSPATSPSEG